jgi:hypothetical protein
MRILVAFWSFLTGKLTYILLLLCFTVPAIAQDTTKVDSSVVVVDSLVRVEQVKKDGKSKTEKPTIVITDKDSKSSKTSLFMSMALPGLGQIYNKNIWKVPIIYGGFALLIYNASENNKGMKEFSQILTNRASGDSTDRFITIYTNQQTADIKNTFKNNRDLSILGIVGVYTLNILDAFVSAELGTFDISDDLSLKVQPSFVPRTLVTSGFTGLTLTLNL